MATTKLDALAAISKLLLETPDETPTSDELASVISSPPKRSAPPRAASKIKSAKKPRVHGRVFVITSSVEEGVVFVKVVIADTRLVVAKDLLEHHDRYEHILSFCPSPQLQNLSTMAPVRLLKVITQSRIVDGDEEAQLQIREFTSGDIMKLMPHSPKLFVITASLSDGIKFMTLVRASSFLDVTRDILEHTPRYKELFEVWPAGSKYISARVSPKRLLRIIGLTHEQLDRSLPRIEIHEFSSGDIINLLEEDDSDE